MKTVNKERQSVCVNCGIRLSTKTPTGEIKWKPSHVDDVGFYCVSCFEQLGQDKGKNKMKKASRPK